MKKTKWKTSEVGEKEPKRYYTKKMKLKRKKKEWGVIGMVLGLAVVIIVGYSSIDELEIDRNLRAKAQSGMLYQKEQLKATESQILSERAMLGKFDPVKKDIIDVAQEKGFEDIGLLFYLAKYESGFDPYAIGINKHKSGVISLDRGTFQINHFYHPAISNKCAFNTRCATNETINIIRRDGGCQAWTTCPY